MIRWLVIVPLLLAGCKLTTFKQAMPDGRIIVVRDIRFLTMTTAAISGTINPTNGVMIIKVTATSRPDNEALEAVAAGVAKGVVAGVKP